MPGTPSIQERIVAHLDELRHHRTEPSVHDLIRILELLQEMCDG